jgi:hypothetical protein
VNHRKQLPTTPEREEALGMTTDMSDDEVMAQVTGRLGEKNSAVPRELIDELVHEEFRKLADRPVRDYLAVLTERAASKRLTSLTHA